MKRRNPIARALAAPQWHQRTVEPDKGRGRRQRPRTSLRAEELRLLEWEEERDDVVLGTWISQRNGK